MNIINFFSTKTRIKLLKNFLQLVVWIVLLWFAYQYLLSHPAEKTSIVSWIQILWQKAQIIFYGLIWGDSALLDDKYKVERSLKELMNTMETSKCLTMDDYNKVKEVLETVKKMDNALYKLKRFEVYNFMNVYMEKINKECK